MSPREASVLIASLGLLALASGCSRGASDPGARRTLACYVGTDSKATCVEERLVGGDDHLYMIESCREVSGRVVKACPEENRIGICERPPSEPTERGVELRPHRVHHYLHPDLATPAAVAEYPQSHCPGWVWKDTHRATTP